MRNVVVDTDILINFLRGKEKAKEFLLSLVENSTIYCSAITVAEVYAGMKEHEKERTTELIESLNIADVTLAIAEKAGEYRRTIMKQSLELDDCLIAATAFVKGSVLATGNGKHYPMSDIEKMIVSNS